MRQFALSFTLAVGLSLSGCATLAPLSPPPAPHAPSAFEKGDLVVRLQAGDSRSLQEAVSVYDWTSIKTLVLIPRLKVGNDFVPLNTSGGTTSEGEEDQLTFTFSDLTPGTFVLSNLGPNRTYQIQARAFDDKGVLISKDDLSVGTVTLTDVAQVSMVNVPLYLGDKNVSATAAARVLFDGDSGPTDTITLTLWKKGAPDVQVGSTVTLSQDDLPRSISLGGLGPNAIYVLMAEAKDDTGALLTSGSVEWSTGNQTELDTKDLTLTMSFGARVSTFAGGSYGYDNTPVDRRSAHFYNPRSAVRGRDGMLYIADGLNFRIRRIGVDGQVTDWVGNGTNAIKAGNGTSAAIGQPGGMAFDSEGNLFVVSVNFQQILKVTPEGEVSVFAGVYYDSWPGYQSVDGPVATAKFGSPQDICIDDQDTLYVTESGNRKIRKISQGNVATLAGGSTTNYLDLSGNSVPFRAPNGINFDPETKSLYMVDLDRVWAIDPDSGAVTAIAGAASSGEKDGPAAQASFMSARGILKHGDTIYVGTQNAIFAVKDGMVSLVAGAKGSPDYKEGIGDAARFLHVFGFVVEPDGSLLVTDHGNHAIRRVVLPPPADE